MRATSTSQYNVSDAEKGSLPSSRGCGDAIVEIDSRSTTIPTRRSDVEALKHHTVKNTTEQPECRLSAAAVEREIRETLTIPRTYTSTAPRLPNTHSIAVEKYQEGYPRQAAFQSSEPSFSIYRGFNYLHSRVILELQDELRCLEGKLADLDTMDFANGDRKRLKSRSKDLVQARQEGIESVRAEIISTITSKLIRYGML